MEIGVVWIYALLSVFLISLISFVGVFTLGIKAQRLKKVLIYFVSFSAGALFGDVFIHLLPEVVEEHGFGLNIGIGVLVGIVLFFILEKFVHWQHCHVPEEKGHVHPFTYSILVGDALHNFIDGLIIGASYLVSVPAGVATTLAVALHEIPQEIGDFGVLIHGGFSKGKALMLNFLSALTAVLGVIVALALSGTIESISLILVPIAAGGFIYIAGSDLIPELHKHSEKFGESLGHLIVFILGILVMGLLLFLGI